MNNKKIAKQPLYEVACGSSTKMNAQDNFLVEHILWSMFTRLFTFSMDKNLPNGRVI